ncbi:thiamine pyrophosphate-binding protein [Achromobacter sp. NPDC058515]|uniref:thiamine pyrophosphate-binding protein n=1 Tax=Achromobacter sp. NPDC058515 TaxID=3346533 RepID=UPI0036675F25
MSGAALVTQSLADAGVKTIFSLSGNQIMPIYDACIDAGIRIVHVRHEAAAVYMADAWAQVTGQVGVALLTAAPGLANGLAPLYSARMAESPVLLLSGDSPLQADGMGAFQELAQTQITQALVKHARRARKASELGRDVAWAISEALSGRPGPVHVALPFDLLTQKAEPDLAGAMPAERRSAKPDAQSVELIGRLLAASARPLALTGPANNRSRAPALLERFSRSTGAPAIPMESPRGLRDPSLGALAESLRQADLILLIGKIIDFTVDFGRQPSWHPEAKVVVVDPDPAALERARRLLGDRMAAGVCADADATLAALAEAARHAPREDWNAAVAQSCALRDAPEGKSEKISPRALCDAVQRVLDQASDPILVCDGGEFGQWAQAYCTAPTRVINGMSGAIGGGICYAIAAKIARPDATVVLLMGDGTAGFHLTEFDTAARENAPFLAVVGNDYRWNAEHVIQVREYGPDRLIGCTLSPHARYDAAAQALGAFGAQVLHAGDLDAALSGALQSNRPACVNVEMDGRPAPVFRTDGSPAPSSH